MKLRILRVRGGEDVVDIVGINFISIRFDTILFSASKNFTCLAVQTHGQYEYVHSGKTTASDRTYKFYLERVLKLLLFAQNEYDCFEYCETSNAIINHNI